MTILALSRPYVWILWAVLIWVFLPEFGIVGRARKRTRSAERHDGGSLQVIMLGGWLGAVIGFWVAPIASTAMPAAWRLPAFVAGLAMAVGGGVLRRRCFRALGEFFTGDVRARADQPVIQTGPYRLVRHPSYTGGMLIFGGIGVALGNWLSAAIMLGMTVLVYLYRVHVEERALATTIGEPYREYMRTHKRFIPGVW
jgi:protein-S-isoprenylcysteine O-methyltransferase Ste14